MTLNVSDNACSPIENVFKKHNRLKKKNHECGVTGVFYVVE